MIIFRHKGDFKKLDNFFEKAKRVARISDLDKYGREGVAALASATPVESGETANSWYYEIKKTNKGLELSFHNSNIQNGVPIAIILHYGHGTNNGGWVEPQYDVNEAIKPIFDRIVESIQKEVANL